MSQRFIGIRHRIKRSAEGESRPTQLAIIENGKVKTIDLAYETDELDWVLGQYPVKWRSVQEDEDLGKFLHRHIKWRKLKRGEELGKPENLLHFEGRQWFIATKVPVEFEGLKGGDAVAMILGGSGDNLAYALSRQAEEISADIMRLPSFILKENREHEKEEDASNLALLAQNSPELFYRVNPRDRDLIVVRESLRARTEAMKARIACEQRLSSRFIGIILRQAGLSEEGSIEDRFNQEKANDRVLQGLRLEEAAREKELTRALKELDIYHELFEPIKGCGPMIAARLISAIIDIRRFETAPQLKKFCSVSVQPDGKFTRRRHGQVANWHPDARQALYLLADQFNRHPDSVWGQRLRQIKQTLRQRHPEVEVSDNGKKRYTDAHIHKMAIWRTLTKFVEWLHQEWWRTEQGHQEDIAQAV